MNYPQSLDYLNSFLNLERIHWSKNDHLWNLERMHSLLEAFEHPEKSFFSVIIAGTKGKGSTGFFLESILTEARVPTGFYTSPHLVDPRERIRVQSQWITKKDWAEVFSCIKQKLDARGSSLVVRRSKPDFTYFEIMTLAAALAFKRKRIQVAIFEVGMGGRLDATNAFGARLAMLTPIGLDHVDILGDTVAKIAAEKAAVINKGAHVVVAKQMSEAASVIQKYATKQKAKLYGPAKFSKVKLGLVGEHQKQNAGLAVRAAKILKANFEFRVPASAMRTGLSKKDWPGRFETLQKNPAVILDGAHNPSSMEVLLTETRRQFAGKGGVVIFGTAKDKDAVGMLKRLAGSFETLFLIEASNSRAQAVECLASLAKPYFKKIFIFGSDIAGALRLAKSVTGKKDVILVTGSFYLIGDVKKQM